VTCPVKQLASKKNWFNPSLPMQKEAAYGLLFLCVRFGNGPCSKPVAVRLAGAGVQKVATAGKPDCYRGT
jgi:hypothetical protein